MTRSNTQNIVTVYVAHDGVVSLTIESILVVLFGQCRSSPFLRQPDFASDAMRKCVTTMQDSNGLM